MRSYSCVYRVFFVIAVHCSQITLIDNDFFFFTFKSEPDMETTDVSPKSISPCSLAILPYKILHLRDLRENEGVLESPRLFKWPVMFGDGLEGVP